MKNLSYADKDYEDELKEGDFVIVELFKAEDIEHNLRTISIELMQIQTIDKHNIAFKPEGASYYLPLYRIRRVINIETSLSYNYKGYDYHHILMDEGQMTEETFVQLKRMEK